MPGILFTFLFVKSELLNICEFSETDSVDLNFYRPTIPRGSCLVGIVDQPVSSVV